MNCREVNEILDAGFTSVGIDITTDIREHLDGCPDCKAYFDELSDMVELLHPLESLELTPAESRNLLNGLDQATKTVKRKKSVIDWIMATVRPAIAAVLVTIIMISVGPGLPDKLTIETDIENLQLTQTNDVDVLPYLLNGDIDLLSELINEHTASYITDQVSLDQADEVLNDISTEEIEWLMDNFTLEI